MMTKKIFESLGLLMVFIGAIPASLSGAWIKSGPMLGYSEMEEVLIWVQTDEPAGVEVHYWKPDQPELIHKTRPVLTLSENNFIAKCIADKVDEGDSYEYAVIVDGREIDPLFREDYHKKGPIPLRFQAKKRWRDTAEIHPPDFTVALGSCSFINEEGYGWGYDPPYGGDYEIFESIYEKHPDLMVWLGDNIYLREADWTTRTGIIHRNNHTRALPHLRALLGSTHHYAIWDDHDYGPDNSGAEFFNKAITTEAFKLFWGNLTYGMPELPGSFSYFNWGDVNFYLLDNRTYRTFEDVETEPFGRPKNHLGKKQVDWLIDNLRYNQSHMQYQTSSFNIIVSGNQVLSDASNHEIYRQYKEEWNYLMDQIMANHIDGVFFLSGDMHFTELSREVRTSNSHGNKSKGQYTFYDLTVSPLTAKVNETPNENSFRVNIFPESDKDYIAQRNFAILEFSGHKDNRVMTVKIYDTYGKLLNGKTGGGKDEVSDLWHFHAQDLLSP